MKKIYNSKIYNLGIVLLALWSLFAELPALVDWLIYALFLLDLIMGTLLYLRQSEENSIQGYLKFHILDMISCIPISQFGFFKAFRLLRIVRLVKVKKISRTTVRLNWTSLFNSQTVKEFAIYLFIYFVGNIYLFGQIEQRDFVDSTHWLVETITSVGYGDVAPTQTVTKVMVILLMLVGVASFGYLNGVITTTVVTQLNKKKEDENSEQ